MARIALAVHGGAGPDSELIKTNLSGYKYGLRSAITAGYAVLQGGGSSLDAVEAAVRSLEDNSLFNAGRGSVLNEAAEVEMEASIMKGDDLSCGAVAVVRQIKNPVSLARAVMEKSGHIYLAGTAATDFAVAVGSEIRPASYFITEHNYDQFELESQQSTSVIARKQLRKKEHGTVGAVAVDSTGTVAAATSTGGLENKRSGRIGDSSIIGVGSYADNNTCAVSCTGDGEFLIRQVCAFHIAALMEYKGLGLQEACNYLIKEKCKNTQGDMGVIGVDLGGNIGASYNSERMHRGWIRQDEEMNLFIYEHQI